ncbi:MAG TPA: sporulation integral membrane protein YtvI [Peptococcaceae bacterium]|nr:sporulation integral membrane protein YtvI [Peptococcaceae bacterium]
MLSLLDYSKRVFIAVVIIIATILIPYGLYKIFPHFVPFILAYMTALALEPLSDWLTKQFKLNKYVSIIIANILFLVTFGFLIYFIMNKIYVQFLGLLHFIQSNGPDIQLWFLNLSQQIQDTIRLLPPETASQINQMIMSTIHNLTNVNLVAKVVDYTYTLSKAIPNIFFLVLIYLLAVFLFGFQMDNIHRRFYSFFKDSSKRKVIYILGDLRKATFGFLKAQLILSTITFILAFIGLSFLKVKYSVIISFIIVLVDVLPVLGTGSVLMPWAIISFLRGNVFLGLGLIILYLIILVIRRVLEPKILGERIGLSAIATLISIWVGFKFMGVLGVFLFPLALIFFKALVRVGIIRLNFRI